MEEIGIRSKAAGLEKSGVKNPSKIYWNLSVAELVEHTLKLGQGSLADNGSLLVATGEFTGRSPKDKFVVKDSNTADKVWWGDVNNVFEGEKFEKLLNKVLKHYEGKELYVRDAYAGADPRYRISLRVVNEGPWANLFANNLFMRPTAAEIESFVPEWHILQAPSFKAVAAEDGTRQHNFTMIDFTRKLILIGGSAYTGEMKKGIFTVLNYLLPFQNVLPMHCSANIGAEGDTAIFFGLSGTGKTTLSADPNRQLVGDDEHGWTDNGVFNFEGGCYAKCVNLTEEKEPQIWNAIKFGTLVENTKNFPNTRVVNYDDISVTENTRAAYPIDFINGAAKPSMGPIPKNIFLLTADAFGVLPPISKLTPGQAMYHFISGYTAKVAGTEAGVTEPQATFSACFGKAFLPLHPTRYAELLGEKIRTYQTNVWLINTGWTGGPYGVGSRMKLSFTRAMISAALKGELNNAEFTSDPVFGLSIPKAVPGVPAEVLVPRETWSDKNAYDSKANHLAELFIKNFAQYESFANEEIRSAAPKALAK